MTKTHFLWNFAIKSAAFILGLLADNQTISAIPVISTPKNDGVLLRKEQAVFGAGYGT
jgi:hypothetical protein